MKNENLFKILVIFVIVMTLSILFSTVRTIYFNQKYKIRDHDEREMICKTGDLVYIESLQRNKEVVTCCELTEEHGVEHITYCEDILIQK